MACRRQQRCHFGGTCVIKLRAPVWWFPEPPCVTNCRSSFTACLRTGCILARAPGGAFRGTEMDVQAPSAWSGGKRESAALHAAWAWAIAAVIAAAFVAAVAAGLFGLLTVSGVIAF